MRSSPPPINSSSISNPGLAISSHHPRLCLSPPSNPDLDAVFFTNPLRFHSSVLGYSIENFDFVLFRSNPGSFDHESKLLYANMLNAQIFCRFLCNVAAGNGKRL
ncbi:unnamed protein product [Arabidopsis lyrata]|uniref:Predicted protein n=1 Tax=Arabidopsis lyrata subsp. lyrata TaxID=81972 RepID=D7KEW1_ARALL|nr:predicted protein [Arabidopsis lyrata subsp. lyrata]CAH8255054.1 unnamed protein product [Arabidopsis lyrata]